MKQISHITKRSNIGEIILPDGVGVELGVQNGYYSNVLLNNSNLDHLFSIDMWAGDRGHDIKEYKNTIKCLMPHYSRNTILKLNFEVSQL